MRTVVGHSGALQVSFVGPFGVGKSTAVRSLSDTDVVNTDVRSAVGKIPRPGSPRKLTTTVGLDYGEWHRPGGPIVAIVGTPGQERFQTVRKSATPRSSAVVLWLFGDQTYAIDEAREWIEFLGGERTWRRLTIAVTRLGDRRGCPTLAHYRELAGSYDAGMPVLPADPRDRESVAELVRISLRGALEVAASA